MPRAPIMPAHHRFVKAVTSALRHRCGVTAKSRLLVATSGGCDSVALLRALGIIAPRRTWRLDLAVGHVQHHLRDATGDAERDAQFVADLAGQLDLPLLRVDLDLARSKGNVEAIARRRRYQALGEMAQAIQAQFVATAHHADDQLETILMRMLRGASVKGLAAMAWRRRLIDRDSGSTALLIRPMLGADRAAARDFLETLDQPWREDHTNADLSRLRARLRHEVLPVLHEIRADASGKAVELADHLREMARMLGRTVDLAADRVSADAHSVTINRIEARDLPRVVLIGLLRRLLAEAGASKDKLGARTLGPIVRAIRDTQGGQRDFRVAHDVQIIITRDTVTLTTDV